MPIVNPWPSDFSIDFGPLTDTPGTLGGTGTAKGVGRSAGTFTQSTQIVNPWTSDFNSDFGPLTAAPPPITSVGMASGTGRGSPAAALVQAARGAGRATGRAALAAVTSVGLRGVGRSTGRLAFASTKGLVALGTSSGIQQGGGGWSSGFSSGFGRWAWLLSAVLPMVASGTAKGNGRNNLGRAGSLAAIGKASGRGVGVVATPAVLRATSRSVGHGRGGALYTVLGSGAVSTAKAAGRASLSALTALNTIGKGTARGAALQGSNTLILTGGGAARSSGNSAPMTQAAGLLAAANTARSNGRGAIGGAQAIIAKGTARARAMASAILFTFLPSRGQGRATGRFGPGALTAAPSAKGLGKASSKAASAYTIHLQAVSQGQSTGRDTALVGMPLHATGLAQGLGQIGGSGTQRLATTRGTANASGRVQFQPVAALSTVSLGLATSRSFLAARFALAGFGLGQGLGNVLTGAIGKLRARGIGAAAGSANVVGLTTVGLTGTGLAISRGSAATNRSTALMAQGAGRSKGRLVAFLGSAALIANGQAIVTGKAGSVVFAPIALAASGRAFSSGVSRTTASTVLHGTGVGLSAGRCAAIASALMMASGRSRAAGQLSAAVAVGFMARGHAESRGRLYASRAVVALGRSAGSGAARIAGYYNVTPDAIGPRLSVIGQLPYFDAMDVGDVDFFSWDWSTRVSRLNDPIVSASVTAMPSDLPIGPVVIVGDIVQVRAGAAMLVETYSLRCTVVLRSGRTLHWSAPVSVECF